MIIKQKYYLIPVLILLSILGSVDFIQQMIHYSNTSCGEKISRASLSERKFVIYLVRNILFLSLPFRSNVGTRGA